MTAPDPRCSHKRRLAVLGLSLGLAACATDKVPELPPAVDMCSNYLTVRIAPAAAREMIKAGDQDQLERNAGNNVFWHDRCGLRRTPHP